MHDPVWYVRRGSYKIILRFETTVVEYRELNESP